MVGSKKVSIIIPVFNAEKTLCRCMESVLKISNLNLEIIIINDGSTDNSISICKLYEKKDKRVQVYSQDNLGVSAARNMGMQVASGEWIGFVDSDDEIIPEIYMEAINILHKCEEFLVWKNIQVDESYRKRKIVQQDLKCGSYKKEDIKIIMNGLIDTDKKEFIKYKKESYDFSSPCAKFYRRDIIEKNNLRYCVDIKIGEDKIFNYQYLRLINTCHFINQYGYIYYQNHNSAMHLYQKDRYLEFYKLYQKFSEIAPDKKKELMQLGIRNYLYMLKNEFCCKNNEKSYIERKKMALKLRDDKLIDVCFSEGSIFHLRKEAVLLAFFAKHRIFRVCDFMLKVKEKYKIKAKYAWEYKNDLH